MRRRPRERRQGWQHEDRALFLVRPDGELERSRPRGESERQPSSRARDFEERHGGRSAQRIALEVAAPIIREARSWRELHEALGREGIRFERKGSGAILFTGASASVKGYAQSAPFAMGKFALRGLAQSMARELAPQGIHVTHFVIDGGIRNPGRTEAPDKPDSMLDPDAIAETYLHVLRQPRSAWTWEIELRPWVERF